MQALSLLGSHQPGLATSKDLQAATHAGGRIWDPVWGAQVPAWPCPPASAGHVESAAGAARRGHRQGPGSKERVQQGQWAALCPTQAVLAWGAPAPLHMAMHCPEALQEGSDLRPLFAKGLSPPRSPGAQGHRLSQCQVSPKDPPQTGVFLQEVLLWGIKSSGLKLGLLRGWARPWFKMLPAQLCFPPSLPVSGIPGCSQQWGLSQSF